VTALINRTISSSDSSARLRADAVVDVFSSTR
jgi:hypothetical protein